eukprot:SAG11_NODE_3462_length_2433_cov_1.595973_3_plen_37_part_00
MPGDEQPEDLVPTIDPPVVPEADSGVLLWIGHQVES